MTLTRREVFDKVKQHLLNQKGKSVRWLRSPACAYRGVNGTKCAAGVLISDEHYSPNMEGYSARQDFVAEALMKSGVSVNDLDLVDALQGVHDCHDPVAWATRLDEIERQEFGIS